MKVTKEKGKESLAALVEKFEKEYSTGRIHDYNEEATKTAFIQPFLRTVLGWDVANRDEVSPEEKISRGRVDYGLKIENRIKLFIEVKPPRADLEKHIAQAVGYGYNRKSVPFVLLTDFEGLKLFDVTIKPDPRNPRKGLKLDLDWQEYLAQFDKIWLLSKESVLKGELEKLLLIKPKERLPVDKAILDDLKKWREKLAKDIFKNNPSLFHSEDREKDADFLKEITQRILDRIIFMRSCEDRKLVHRRSLKELFEERTETLGKNTMIFLNEEFKHYNIIFDSDLFRPQEWEVDLAVDFTIMNDIIMDTYNPYQFDVIPLEVLGNIYEQYLGYTIRLTDHQVKYELKPEVRKAGGVYYTPEYIVDYIVKNTVGKLLQGLPANRFLSFRAKRGISSKTKKLRILDPACGSGSFLIRAYEEMLNYYRNEKKKKMKSKKEQRTLDLKEEEAQPRLTIEEKSKILQEHIFGVDIDEQAVEVTKLSLMLKMLEGEFGIVPGRSILPMLDKNIRCGNSLISGDTLELKKYFGEDWYKVKAFNWKDEFRKIMVEEGGFDAVIGNPPYGAELYSELYMKRFYPFSSGMKEVNSYLYFTEQSYKLLKDAGNFGFIIPDTFLLKPQYESFRKFLIEKLTVYEITETGVVFEQSRATPNALLFFAKSLPAIESRFQRKQLDYRKGISNILEDLRKNNWLNKGEFSYREWQKSYCLQLGRYVDERRKNIVKKILVHSNKVIPLRRIQSIEVDRGFEGSKTALLKEPRKSAHQILIPENVSRYMISDNPTYFATGYKKSFEYDRILVIRIRNTKISERIVASIENKKRPTLKTLQQIYFRAKSMVDLKYMLGLLNSRVMNYYCNHFLIDDINKEYLLQLPIYKIDFAHHKDKKFHDKIVALVEVMLDLNKKIQTAKGSEKERIKKQIKKTDNEIDELVYKLYGITEEETRVIEGRA